MERPFDYPGSSQGDLFTNATNQPPLWSSLLELATATSPEKRTQAQRVIIALSHQTPGHERAQELCGAALLRMFIPRYAAIIHDLRSQGIMIDTMPCDHGMKVAHYWLQP